MRAPDLESVGLRLSINASIFVSHVSILDSADSFCGSNRHSCELFDAVKSVVIRVFETSVDFKFFLKGVCRVGPSRYGELDNVRSLDPAV